MQNHLSQDSRPDDADGQSDRQREMDDRQENQTDQITESGSITPMDGKHPIHCLTIIGQIEGHFVAAPQNKTTKYEHVIPQLVAVEQDPRIEGLLMILNTVGGDVEAGLALAELVSGMKKPTVSLVLGGGHSIGVPLACSAKQSFIVPSATMTIHPVRMNGVVLGVPQTLYYFERMQDRIIDFVIANSRMPGDRFRELLMNTNELVMDVGTTLDGDTAVSEGLIDHLGGLSDAIECLYEMIEQNQAEESEQSDAPPVPAKPGARAGGKRAKGGAGAKTKGKPKGSARSQRPPGRGGVRSGDQPIED